MSSDKSGISGEINFEFVVIQRLQKLGNLADTLFSGSNLEKKADGYYFAIQNFLSMVEPYISGDSFNQELQDIYDKADERIEAKEKMNSETSNLTKQGANFKVYETLRVSNEIMRLVVTKLKEEGLLIPESIAVKFEEK